MVWGYSSVGHISIGPAVATPVIHRVPIQWFRVSKCERIIYTIAGVKIFGWLLNGSGWTRFVSEPLRRFSGKKAGLAALEQSLRGHVSAHATCFIVHVLLAIFALFSKHPLNAALWMLCPGIIVPL